MTRAFSAWACRWIVFAQVAAFVASATIAHFVASATVAHAQVRAQPEVELAYNSLTAARYNPLGLVTALDMTLRLRLFEHDSDILKQNYVGIGFTTAVSPAWGRIGVLAEVNPLTILRLWGAYELHGYFGTFNYFSSLSSPYSEASDHVIEHRSSEPGTPNYPNYGGVLTLGGRVQAQVGPIVVRNIFRAIHWSYQVRDGNRVFHDPIMDMLIGNDGWILTNDVDVLARFDFGLAIGARWTYVAPLYEPRHYAPDEDPSGAPNNEIHRLGLLAAYSWEDNDGARFDHPTIILMCQWHLMHRYRTGAETHVGVPYIALAFQFSGDLLADH